MLNKKKVKEAAEHKLEKAYGVYDGYITNIAKEVFQTSVKPFLRERGWEFAQGMGTWFITVGPGMHIGYEHIDQVDPETAEILELCAIELPGNSVMDLGMYMPDYKGEE